ncbi:hypothetical protein FQZ97_1207820 [compost metagenome]
MIKSSTITGTERKSQVNTQASRASSGERDTRASASPVPKKKPSTAPSAVSSSVRPRPASTGSEKNHSANTGQPQRGLVSTECSTRPITATAKTVPTVRAG